MPPIALLAAAGVLLFFGFMIVATVVNWIKAGERERHRRVKKKIKPLIATAEEAKEKVRSLGLPPLFSDVWDDNIPDCFTLWRKPDYYFKRLDETIEMFPRIASCVPLWDNGDCVYAFDLNTGVYVKCYYLEDPSFEVLADNYQAFAALELASSVYAGSETLAEEADLLEFKHLDKLLKWADEPDDGESLEEGERRLITSFPPGR